jgi:hypothetical protein
MNPQARTNDLTIRALGEETLVMDLLHDTTHYLNLISASVFQLADGSRSVEQLAHDVSLAVGKSVHVEAVQLALEQLSRRNLLTTPVAPASKEVRYSRRDALKVAAAAMAIPLLMSIPSPVRAQSISQPPPPAAAPVATPAPAPEPEPEPV